ncbi:hypothetical protein SAMN00790413_01440 [Deinococcus hopiensis KR-140]|uniref:Uncharacterized protein n=1 Tax=Deinococcus hopiensis KR-140 TaxID=695939 RepID=A0A1W1VFI2_9DEIO|nr:hypothetical protein SAMN00790413_01440 [Deinococcus hopiensis KR-140]
MLECEGPTRHRSSRSGEAVVGGLVPGVGRLGEVYSARELEGLAPEDARELRRWHNLLRGRRTVFRVVSATHWSWWPLHRGGCLTV